MSPFGRELYSRQILVPMLRGRSSAQTSTDSPVRGRRIDLHRLRKTYGTMLPSEVPDQVGAPVLHSSLRLVPSTHRKQRRTKIYRLNLFIARKLRHRGWLRAVLARARNQRSLPVIVESVHRRGIETWVGRGRSWLVLLFSTQPPRRKFTVPTGRTTGRNIPPASRRSNRGAQVRVLGLFVQS